MSIKRRIIELLSDGKLHSAKELAAITHRFGAVIHSLRDEGYEIATIPMSHNNFAYQMLKVPVVAENLPEVFDLKN